MEGKIFARFKVLFLPSVEVDTAPYVEFPVRRVGYPVGVHAYGAMSARLATFTPRAPGLPAFVVTGNSSTFFLRGETQGTV